MRWICARIPSSAHTAGPTSQPHISLHTELGTEPGGGHESTQTHHWKQEPCAELQAASPGSGMKNKFLPGVSCTEAEPLHWLWWFQRWEQVGSHSRVVTRAGRAAWVPFAVRCFAGATRIFLLLFFKHR